MNGSILLKHLVIDMWDCGYLWARVCVLDWLLGQYPF